MDQKVSALVAIFLAVVAITAPIATSLYLARQQSIADQESHVAKLAQDVLRRTDRTSEQLANALTALETTAAKSPCSPDNVRLMAQLALLSEQLQGIGYVSDDQLLCASFGMGDSPALVGPADYRSADGSDVRASVELPISPGTRFILVTRASSGYTGIIHPRLPLDILADGFAASLGIVGYSSQKVMDASGFFDPSWIAALGDHDKVEIIHDHYVVSVHRSKVGDYVAFAALPAVSLWDGIRRPAAFLLPMGVIAGALLAYVVLHTARSQLSLPALLRAAVRNDEFLVEYQPVINLQTGEWVGAEALVRWRRPGGEIVCPDLFIPVAEDTGVICRITERVLDLIGAQANGFFTEWPGFHFAINISSADLQSDRLAELLKRLADRTGACSGNLVLEVTERGLIKGEKVKNRLRELRTGGVRIVIDDFGTGFSSLSYLKSFELDALKIDKSFVDAIGIDAATSHVVFHLIEMAKGLKLELIAEGIEEESQLAYLRRHGVHHGQGWLLGKPMPLSELLRHLRSTRENIEAPAALLG